MSLAALKVGLLGAGAIGQILAAALDADPNRAALVAIADQDRPAAESLAAQLKMRPPIVEIDDLVRRSDLIIEAASQGALPEIVPRAIRAQKDLMVMSVGGLLEHEEWIAEAERQGCRIHIPSGAIAGLDGLRAAAMGRLSLVILTSRKPLAALRGAKYVTERRIDLDRLKEETVLFEGTPEDAAGLFLRRRTWPPRCGWPQANPWRFAFASSPCQSEPRTCTKFRPWAILAASGSF